MLDQASQSMKEGNFPSLGKLPPTGLGKKTMRLGGDGPLIREGMFSPEALGGTFSPATTTNESQYGEEAKSLTTVKRGNMVRKKILSSKTQRESRAQLDAAEQQPDSGDQQALLASETLDKLKKLVKTKANDEQPTAIVKSKSLVRGRKSERGGSASTVPKKASAATDE